MVGLWALGDWNHDEKGERSMTKTTAMGLYSGSWRIVAMDIHIRRRAILCCFFMIPVEFLCV